MICLCMWEVECWAWSERVQKGVTIFFRARHKGICPETASGASERCGPLPRPILLKGGLTISADFRARAPARGCPIGVKLREERMSLDKKRGRQSDAHVS